ncbi:hypothetical protein KY290_031056 [Solanum tuberosum]|uniref:Endonuclease/exonuclease/phosphatase n=1 Tax=Solanum tuberosum TaxID=4113 RepID=A0ABQ7U9B0_SOLTU|nr:hypothetical protein KY290_031056 [Solanum tuberosum]
MYDYGDYNVILGEEEKIGGLPVYPQKYDDFVECLTSSGLDDVNFSGNPFTWRNGRADGYNIWQQVPNHAPLLLSCIVNNGAIRPLKFLNFSTEKEDLREVVEHNWVEDALEDMFVQFKQKQKRTKKDLTKCMKEKFGDTIKQLAIIKEIVKLKAQVFYIIHHLHIEVSYNTLRQN